MCIYYTVYIYMSYMSMRKYCRKCPHIYVYIHTSKRVLSQDERITLYCGKGPYIYVYTQYCGKCPYIYVYTHMSRTF